MRITVLAVLFGLALSSVASRAADTFEVDPAHSSFIFKIKHMNTSYTYGRFDSASGTIVVDDADASKSSVEITLKADSVDTNNAKRDEHLKGPDFFNAKQFPNVTFKSKTVTKSGDADYTVTGDFTLLGVTKPVTVKLTKIGGGQTQMGFRIGFEGAFTIKRSEYGMTQMLAGVGDDVMITVSVEAIKK